MDRFCVGSIENEGIKNLVSSFKKFLQTSYEWFKLHFENFPISSIMTLSVKE